MTRELFLHVGYPKTGSSFIQSSLVISAENLTNQGILYPVESAQEIAASGRITSGNGMKLSKAFESQSLEKFEVPSSEKSVLYSSEFLFWRMIDRKNELEQFLQSNGFERVNILLFIRNPIPHAISYYHQRIKRHGYSDSIEAFLESYDEPSKVKTFIDDYKDSDRVNLSIKNYSNVDNILFEVEHWLRLEQGTLEDPPKGQINRSLTHGELELIRALNKQIGDKSKWLSNKLCEQLADVKSDKT